MRFSIISILALALTVSASPLVARQITTVADTTQVADGNQDVGNQGQNAGNSATNKGKVIGDYTVEQGVQTCGNAQLNCCNKIEKQGDTTNAGLLGSLFGSGDIGVQCTPINVAAVIAAQVPINKQCQANAACCQGESSQNGLVNLGCVALSSLV
ncbi:fungal hydrophobin-domain-containing protein [Tuber borchii]|uniref:Hydrophobin n=1 Tax=Tuber borchii TaxID=42251 RepID=A0A2T6ZM77_TUBBO|nr:fungal hydrophobin-domain-containing protein [Tuber borchii]